MIDEPPTNKPIVVVVIAGLVAIAAAGGWYYWHTHQAPPPAPVATAPPVQEPPAEDTIEHPVPAPPAGEADAANKPLPALSDSDGAFGEALSEAAGPSVAAYVIPESLIRHIVVTVDNLPRQKVALDKRPIVAVPGTFAANGDELRATLDASNFQRYQPMVGALEKVDVPRLVAVYVRFYPLFQKAYQDLGYPNGYFNDRLIQVIDLLLATPQPGAPIELVRPNVMYQFADPALEARPAGQKMLIRMGPDNAAAVKAKLRQLRAALVAAKP